MTFLGCEIEMASAFLISRLWVKCTKRIERPNDGEEFLLSRQNREKERIARRKAEEIKIRKKYCSGYDLTFHDRSNTLTIRLMEKLERGRKYSEENSGQDLTTMRYILCVLFCHYSPQKKELLLPLVLYW